VKHSTETSLPIFVIGDSHTLPYKNLVFRERWCGKWVMVHSKYVPSLTTHNFYAPTTSEFDRGLIEFLDYEGLTREGHATHLAMNDVDFAIAKASGQPKVPPLLLITAGDIDIRGAIMPMLKDNYDFVPPFETNLPTLNKQLLPWDVLGEAIASRIRPFVAGLQELMACGFTRVYVQGIVPPTPNEARVFELHNYNCPLTVRTKLVMAFNRRLIAECASINVTVLNIWDRLTKDGTLRTDLDFDGVHLPPVAAQWYLEALLDDAIDTRGKVANHRRYELFYRTACGLDPFSGHTGMSAAV
jgi:lysophospholipase L1-like esterase